MTKYELLRLIVSYKIIYNHRDKQMNTENHKFMWRNPPQSLINYVFDIFLIQTGEK